jgi:hypothetical protein
MKVSRLNHAPFVFPIVAMLAGCAGQQSASEPPSPISTQRIVPAVTPDTVPFLITNDSGKTIYFNKAVEAPPGKAWCPWVLYFPAFPDRLAPGDTGPGQPNILSYDGGCSPATEPAVWSFSYGTNLKKRATICKWTAQFTGAVSLSFEVLNRRDTACSEGYDRTNGTEYFYYHAK